MAPNKNYTVDKKQEVRQMSPGGDVVTVYRISATSAGGTYFTVDVPEHELDKADKYLSEKATRLDSIK